MTFEWVIDWVEYTPKHEPRLHTSTIYDNSFAALLAVKEHWDEYVTQCRNLGAMQGFIAPSAPYQRVKQKRKKRK